MAKVIFKQPHEASQKKKVINIYKSHLRNKVLLLFSVFVHLLTAAYWIAVVHYKIPVLLALMKWF